MIDRVRVGHWTDTAARTGCTVVLFPEGTVASGEIRGGAPATREFALLDPQRLVSRIDAVVLAGGSAYGLAAADGVMCWCEEQGSGVSTPGGVVPIVVGMALYDLTVGDPSVRPGPAEGRAACEAAREGPVATGAVGAGCGTMVGSGQARRGGGIAFDVVRVGDLRVAALAAVNAYGDIFTGSEPLDLPSDLTQRFVGQSTTLVVVATNATLDKLGCQVVAQGGQDGLARALWPSHTRVDGDAVVAAATGEVVGLVDQVRLMAVRAVGGAVRAAVPR